MNYILLHWNYGRESMRMVADKMKEDCDLVAKKNSGDWWQYGEYEDGGKVWFKISPKNLSHILDEGSNIINWGNCIFLNDEYFILNKPSAISRASNKTRCRIILQDNDVRVPKTWVNGEFPQFPCIARPQNHHAGKDFYVLNSEGDLKHLDSQISMLGWYLSEIFEKTHEYRVHCTHGKVLIVNEKPLIEGEIRANQAVNHESWRELKWHEFNPVIVQESLKAVEVLGLDYGAVDIMYNAQENSVAICEVNTSPSVNTEYASGKYAKYFDWCIRHDFPQHFPLDGGTAVFYNNILEDRS